MWLLFDNDNTGTVTDNIIVTVSPSQVSELYLTLCLHHRGDSVTCERLPWQQCWVDPVLSTLCEGERLQKTHVIEVGGDCYTGTMLTQRGVF